MTTHGGARAHSGRKPKVFEPLYDLDGYSAHVPPRYCSVPDCHARLSIYNNERECHACRVEILSGENQPRLRQCAHEDAPTGKMMKLT